MLPASFTTSSFSPDALISDTQDPLTRKRTLLLGQNLKRGAVLGAITAGAAVAAAFAGNTGNGTFGAITTAAGVKPGAYRLILIAATAFELEGPDGVIVATGKTGVAFAGVLGFTLTAGGTAFVAGDGFTITVAAGSAKRLLSLAAAADGSQNPIEVLADDCDATAADTECVVYIRADVNDQYLIYGAGHSAATVTGPLQAQLIYVLTGQGG